MAQHTSKAILKIEITAIAAIDTTIKNNVVDATPASLATSLTAELTSFRLFSLTIPYNTVL